MFAALSGLSLSWRIGLVLLAVALLVGAVTHALQEVRDSGKATEIAAQARQHDQDVQEARAADQATSFRQQEANDAYTKRVALGAAADRAADAAASRLLQRAANVPDACRLSNGAPVAFIGASAASGDGRGLRPGLLDVVTAAARRLAARANANAVAGQLAVDNYNGLTP